MLLNAQSEHLPLKAPFSITGYTFTGFDVVTVRLVEGDAVGQGEAAGVYYHGETAASILAQLDELRPLLTDGTTPERLQALLPPGGARNALDCALWDLEAKRSGIPVSRTAGIEELRPVPTTYTISAEAPETMAQTARAYAPMPRLKLKLTGEDDAARIRAVRQARPEAWIAIDANQGFTRESLEDLLPLLIELDVRLIEQPVRIGDEERLRDLVSPIPLAADESIQEFEDIARLGDLFQVINIKLDKCGGLTRALSMIAEVRRLGLVPMIGCMPGSSLAVAPAFIAAQLCEIVDLDAPLLLAEDRAPGFVYDQGTIMPQKVGWGFP